MLVAVKAATLTLLTLATLTLAANAPGDGCDWSGSGLDYNEEERGVQPVYLRCAQGRVEWKYPRGALRVVLRHGTSGKEFKGCLKAGKGFHGARIYLEGHRTLHTLYATDDRRHSQLPRCFSSRQGQVALYVEADTNSLLPWGANKAEFSYDLQPRPRQPENSNRSNDPQEDCRPCSSAELLRHFCTADFVVKGSISGIYQNEELSRTELMIRAQSVLRQNAAIFRPANDFQPAYGTLHVPLYCGVKQGGGEFLFLGRIMLDEPLLLCAPRLEEWQRVKAAALKEGTNQCELS